MPCAIDRSVLSRTVAAAAAASASLAMGCASIHGFEEGQPVPIGVGEGGAGAEAGQAGHGGLGPFGGAGGTGGTGGTACELGPIETPELVAELDSEWRETGPSVSPDGLTIYFSSTRLSGDNALRDVVVAHRPDLDSPFGAPTLLGGFELVNDDTDPSISTDGLALYFGSRRSAETTGDIWIAERSGADGDFGAAHNLGTSVNSTLHESDPCISADDLELFFASSRPDDASADLWVSTRTTKADPWQTPQPVTELNTADHEHDPFISADGLTLYFTRTALGATDASSIFRATRPSRLDPFGTPELVDALESTARDEDFAMTPDGRVIFFTSTRAAAAGSVDIWTARRSCL